MKYMRKILTLFVSVFTSTVFAVPIVWTIPPTTVGANTVSGTFTYDAATSTLTSINVTSTGAINQTYNFVGSSGAFIFGQTAASVSSGSPGIAISAATIPDAPTANNVNIFLVTCNVTGGLCSSAASFQAGPVLAGLTGVVSPVSVPTLSEWAMIIMASLMALFAIRKMRRQ